MSRRAAAGMVGLAAGLLLPACALERAPAPPQTYTLLGAAPAARGAGGLASGGSQGSRDGPLLRLDPVRAPAWLSGQHVYYRLLYRSESAINSYADALWVDPPAPMLRTLALEALRARAGVAAVVGPEDPVVADLVLRLDLLELEQVFETPDRSVGVLRVRATLYEPAREALLAQRDFAYRAPAASADAAGGVAAEREAANTFARDLAAWVAEQIPAHEAAAEPARPSASCGVPAWIAIERVLAERDAPVTAKPGHTIAAVLATMPSAATSPG